MVQYVYLPTFLPLYQEGVNYAGNFNLVVLCKTKQDASD